MAFSDPQKNLETFGLHEGSQVADLGSGSGFYTLAAAQIIGAGGKVYSIDVQEELLSRIKNAAHQAGLHNIEVIHGDIENVGGTRLRDQSVDAALACNVVFQLENKDGFLDEVKRILKPMGRFLVIDWMESFGGLGPQPEHVVKETDMKSLAEKHGFMTVKTFDAGDHHYGIVFSKK